MIRPTLTNLVDRQRDDLAARLDGADSRLRRSVLDVLARVHGAGLFGLYGYLDTIAAEAMPDTATDWLARHARIWGVTPKVATAATGDVSFTGVAGSPVPAATALLRSDGVEYLTIADVVLTGGVGTIAVAAALTGSAANALAGQQLTLVSPVAGVSSIATIGGDGLKGGAEEEDPEALRARLLDRIRQPPHGGNLADYKRWTLECAGVTRAWVYPGWLGPGTVGVTFVCEARTDIIPGPGDLDVVRAYLDDRRPVTAALTVFAPIIEAIPLHISLAPGTAAVRAAVQAELIDLFQREAQPGGILPVSHIREAISTAAGESDHVLISPTANVVSAPGRLARVGAITW
ncbi:baseplate J/gp47 family protein [Sphingomonas naphthae]|uniref:Baseplate J/gp47 family protein n=1 Tax=Sphingomonas naphthae TaxID=1813468 RepID=A0ABY7TGH9_9SPHN|nr:baseplate J/gp47 family protein [Sphingomonas naphthae]WCT72045.1 baseplate J/gp47 family protein [Sphingomonas naphthae]